ncbi:MAG: hypothetical protein H0X30_39195 [Anaerolineae bacterium]|nr:hypothetical protein [Anaerolineae bacterium]
MVTLDRAKLHKDIDELADDRLVEVEAAVLVAKDKKTHPGSAWARALYDLFEPVRQGVLESGMTEEEVNTILDEELEAVRQELYEKRIAAEKNQYSSQ